MYERLDKGEPAAKVAREECVDAGTLRRRYEIRADSVSGRGPPPMLGRRGEVRLVEWLQQ